MKITFLGAAGLVTGSMYLVQHQDATFLVDCGQFQGTVDEENLNYESLPFDASKIDFMILTHAHVDHSGRIPLLVKKGFTGKIYCTYPTSYLADILLRDSGKIHEAEAAYDNKKRLRAGLDPIEPLFNEDDAVNAIQYFYPVKYLDAIDLSDHLTLRFHRAGHLLGSAFIELISHQGGKRKTFVFSGDLGNSTSSLEMPPDTITSADYLITESTYGGKIHEGTQLRTEKLIKILKDAFEHKGTVLIPSFAVGRTQELIFEIKHYLLTHEEDTSLHFLYDMPIYVDSPLALEATKIYKNNTEYMRPELLDDDENPFEFKSLHLVTSIEASMALNRNNIPKVIISASGMCEAGRIKHHLKHNLWKPNTHLVFVGYQGEDTLGRTLLDGASQVTILDEHIAVKARIHKISGYSGHADMPHLMAWISAINDLKKVMIVHGEPASSLALKEALDAQGLSTTIPKLGESIVIDF